jgi:D-apionate oxidoisomerase
MTRIAIFGAGGKMGCRIIDNLRKWPYTLLAVEISTEGISRLAARGLAPVAAAEAIPAADVAILAVPDRAIGAVAREAVPGLAAGAMVMTLDPAAAHAGELPARRDISYFVTHPCHPPIFGDETDPEARKDYFGGVRARQNIVCALMQGADADYRRGEEIARAMFAPVMRAHRITVEQMAILEPAMSETVTACCCTVIREALDEAIRRGVPAEAARDFMLGHVNIPLAIVFEQVGSSFSDGAKLIIGHGKRALFRPDWKKVFEPDSVRRQVEAIVRGTPPGEE